MTNSTLTLLNLACIKHTGQSLPQSCLLETDWKYVKVNGKKVAVWSPSPLANPLRVSYPNDDIEQKILRRIVVSELDYTFNRVPKDIKQAKIDIAVWFIIGQYKILSTPTDKARPFVAPWIETLYEDCEQHRSFNKSLKWWNEQVKLANEFGMKGREAYYYIYSLVGFKVSQSGHLIDIISHYNGAEGENGWVFDLYRDLYNDPLRTICRGNFKDTCIKLFRRLMSWELSDIKVNIKQTAPYNTSRTTPSRMFAPFRASQGFVKLLSINHRLPIFDSIQRMKGGLRSHQIYERFFTIPNCLPLRPYRGYIRNGTQDGTFHTDHPSYNSCWGNEVGMVKRHEIDKFLLQTKFQNERWANAHIITQDDNIRRSKKAVKGYYEVLMTAIANSLGDNAYKVHTIQNDIRIARHDNRGITTWRKFNNFSYKGKRAKDWLETDWNEPLSPEILMRVFNPNKKLEKERINEKLIDWFHTPK